MEIRLLGLVEAFHAGQAVPLGGPKPRALLAMLALHANEPVSTDRLIDGLWGERPPATAPKLVQVLVSQLRKQLPADAEIVTRGRGYELRVDADDVDALRFERLVTLGENGSHLSEALALWRGPPLDDLADEPFAAPEIRRLEDLWLQAREAAIDSRLAEGRHAEVLGELDELVRAHPLRERLYGQRMLALYRCGRQAEALEAFRDARQVLLAEVGLEPGPELRRLNDAILRQDPDLDGPRPPPFARRARRRPWRLLAAAAVAAIAAMVVLAATLLAGSDGLAAIPEDATGEIDPDNGHIVMQYGVGHAPDALTAGGGSVWSANNFDGTVSRVDRGQVRTISVGGEPTALAYGDGSLWVADGENRRVYQINSATNRVVKRWPAGNGPRGVAVGGGALWVTSAIDGQVERRDLARGGVQRIELAGGPAAVAFGGGAVWVAGEGDAVVTRLDPRSGAPLKSIGVGNGPAGIAVGYGAVWVANRDDGTVTRIDTRTDVGVTVPVGGRPVAVAAGVGAIWVADDDTDAVIRIDPTTRRVTRHIPVRSAPSALAVGGGSVWAATSASRASHRGGTLRYESLPFDFCNCIDPASYGGIDWPVLSLAYDGLVAYRRIQGAGGSTLVPDLATSIPQSTDGGRTYAFQLRSGLRFSDGTPVRPEDFRASIERFIRLTGQYAAHYNGIVGADGCSRKQCDLSQGIETDGPARTIAIHLRQPDPEFLHKLAMPLGYVLPSRAPTRFIRTHPQPGTGPYTVAAFSPTRGVRLVRNRRFHSWSADARPSGFPDVIDVRFSKKTAAQIVAVQHGRADAFVVAGVDTALVPVAVAHGLAVTDASHVYTSPFPSTNWLFLNVRERPFNDARVRRALSYAIDHRRLVALAGGSEQVGPTCQIIPPGLPGYAPVCPYGLATPAGTWVAPELARARRLVAASGTRGARVQVMGFPKYAAVVRYAREVLQRLGYRARVRILPDTDRYFAYLHDPRHHAQAGMQPWVDDYLTPSSFFDSFTCGDLARNGADSSNFARFCHPAVDAADHAALAAQGPEANARWAALERRVLAAAPAVPLFNRRTMVLVSDRVGNAEAHQELGPLLDQFWVR